MTDLASLNDSFLVDYQASYAGLRTLNLPKPLSEISSPWIAELMIADTTASMACSAAAFVSPSLAGS